MTPALQKIVDAIWAEIERQVAIQGHMSAMASAVRFDKPNYLGETDPNLARICGNVDLERVARAGLAAIPPKDLAEAIADAYEASATRDSVVAFREAVASGLRDAILKETAVNG